jgi:hypothetical protein
MFSYELMRLIAEERERTVQESMRVRRLLEKPLKALHELVSGTEGDSRYPGPFRSRAPRASSTMRWRTSGGSMTSRWEPMPSKRPGASRG